MRNYYIIGSKRKFDEGPWQDMWAAMLRAKAVDVGYVPGKNLKTLYGKSDEAILDALKDEEPKARNAHRLFLNLRPGDLVAVKNFAAPYKKQPRLSIHGYAVVRARSGKVYHHSKTNLPHQISVDFVDTNLREFKIGGYGGTISRLHIPEHIKEIFRPVLREFSEADQSELKPTDVRTTRENALRNLEGNTYWMKGLVTTSSRHNKLQNRLYKMLVEEHGVENVLMEQDYVDLQVRIGRTLTIYEVKPFDNAFACLRAGLGQILQYGWRYASDPNLKIKLVIVGPCKLTSEEKSFLAYIKAKTRQEIEYLPLE